MANNTTANASTVAGGPTLSMYDISAGTPPTTGLASCAVIYAAATSSTQPTVSCEANPLFASITDGTNKMPTMDAAARKGFVLVTDGTNSCKLATPNAALAENAATWLETASLLCALDTGAGAGSQAVQCLVESTAAPNLRVGIYNGTAHMPAGDTAAHRIYIQHTDGTNATPSMDVAARKAFVSVTDGTNTMPTMDVAARKGFVLVTNGTQNMPTGDALARSIFTAIGDGTTTAGVLVGAAALKVSSGGTTTASVATGAGNTVVKNAAGRLARVLVTTAGTGSGNVLFFDNATTNAGTVIGIVPATIAIGTYYYFDLPAAAGITCQNVASGPVMTVSYD